MSIYIYKYISIYIHIYLFHRSKQIIHQWTIHENLHWGRSSSGGHRLCEDRFVSRYVHTGFDVPHGKLLCLHHRIYFCFTELFRELTLQILISETSGVFIHIFRLFTHCCSVWCELPSCLAFTSASVLPSHIWLRQSVQEQHYRFSKTMLRVSVNSAMHPLTHDGFFHMEPVYVPDATYWKSAIARLVFATCRHTLLPQTCLVALQHPWPSWSV